ncbi:MAG: hypothetical protein KAI24_02800 [Planctomycetes bacterium]|nr:hypothetical protein [Planctomycetota bacterium]
MSRILTSTFLSLFLVACSSDEPTQPSGERQDAPQASAPSGDAGAADPYDDSDCNLETVLDPDKPGAPGHLIPSERNPNGDSELAVLMRLMVEDLKENRIRLQGGDKLIKMWPKHRTMRCAWPTNPAERNEGYDGRAQSYLATVRAFDEAPAKETYNAVVNACVACHQINCGGVIGFIETLRWE